jgi:hypothetical protein
MELLHGNETHLKKLKFSCEIIKLYQRGGEYQWKLRINFYESWRCSFGNKKTHASTKRKDETTLAVLIILGWSLVQTEWYRHLARSFKQTYD